MSSPAGGFGGELGLVGLFDLGQLLMLNRATGALVVTRGERSGTLYFDAGRIVHAIDDRRREGEHAAYRLFAWKEGRFEFRLEAPTGARTIPEGTEALMLEAARRFDEKSEDGEPVPGEEARLLERRDSFEALRDAFRTLAVEAKGTRTDSLPALEELLVSLRDASGVLVCRAGEPPRLPGDEGNLAATRPLDPSAFAALLARCRGAAREGESRAAPIVRVLELAGGRLVLAAVTGSTGDETIWIRAAAITAPREPRPEDAALDPVVDMTHGLALVGGSGAEHADALLDAILARRIERRAGVVIRIARDGAPIRHGARGLVVTAAPEEAAIALTAARPGAVAVTAWCLPEVRRASVLLATPLALVALAVTDAAGLLARWQAGDGDPGASAAWRHEPLAVVTPGAGNRPDVRMHAHGADSLAPKQRAA